MKCHKTKMLLCNLFPCRTPSKLAFKLVGRERTFTLQSVAGIAILGGGGPSMGLAVTLALSTLWRHGWWLYLQPECGPVAFILSGTTADVALGFLLSSLIQVKFVEWSNDLIERPIASK